jgi:VWFA-related protein
MSFKHQGFLFYAVCGLGVCLLASVDVRAQQTDATARDTNATQNTYTLRTGTKLVVEDVTVTGADGKPVHGLKAKDFVLTENGQVEQLRNFAEHTPAEASQAPQVSEPKLAPGIFTNYTQKSDGGPANVLLLDMLNTPLRDQQYARQQIASFLDHAPAGTQIAIFGLNGKLTMLQGFTNNYGLLKAALARKSASGTSQVLDDTLGGGGSGNTGATGISEALADTAPEAKELIANAQQFEANSESFQLGLRTVFTLDALNEIARYLSSIPGRKNLIWFSGSFPIDVLPNASTDNGFASMSSHEAEFRETMSLLASGQIALYPVDARGLQTTGTFNAASQTTKYNRDATAMGKDITKFDAQIASENTSMLTAARETGGRAFVNTNNLSEAVADAVEDGANYYTMTYRPATDAKATDDPFRKISVSLPGKPYTLTYRRGYFTDTSGADVGHETAKDAKASSTGTAAQSSAITRSMVRGAPVPTQIEFTVRVRPATGREEATAAQGNEPVVSEKAAAGPFLRLAVDYAIDQHSLGFKNVDGKYRGDFEFIAFVYDANGTLLNRVGSTLHANFAPEVYAAFLRRPFSFNQDVSVPRVGDLFLRIAVHDLDAERIGAVEVPVDSVRGLPPLDVSEGH